MVVEREISAVNQTGNDHQNVLKPSCDLADCLLIYGGMRARLNAYKLLALEYSIGLRKRFQICMYTHIYTFGKKWGNVEEKFN